MTAMAIDIRNASRRVSSGLMKVMWGTSTLFHSHLRMNALRMMTNNIINIL